MKPPSECRFVMPALLRQARISAPAHPADVRAQTEARLCPKEQPQLVARKGALANGSFSCRNLRLLDFPRIPASVLVCLSLTGCFGFLKPAPSSARHFVLTPVASDASPAQASGLSVGVGPVKVPTYLFDSSLAVRTSNNEIFYETSVLWAERLDNGIQRVLASNLATFLPSDSVRMSSWRSDDVSAEVYVTVNQFDVDDKGQGVLTARWRIAAPGGEKILKTGTSQFTRQGPAPGGDPSGAINTLSELAGDLSRQLSQVVKEVAVASNNGKR